jgi:hypothetical protein
VLVEERIRLQQVAFYNATPIVMYSVVHTGANIHEGGFQEGFSMLWYQLPGPVVAKKPAVNPTNNGIATEIISFKILLITVFEDEQINLLWVRLAYF